MTDVAFAVCTALDRAGATGVLTGGSAATYYLPKRYQSLDLDFVLRYGFVSADVIAGLQSLGFQARPTGDFSHPDVTFTVEFPAGPLMIGRDVIEQWRTDRRGSDVLHVVTPADCVRDRFMHYYAWGDVSALALAVDIARSYRSDVDLRAFEAWAAREAEMDSSYDRARLRRFLRMVRAT